MGKLQIEGGRRLEGVIPISGAKNSALAIIMAAALAKGEHFGKRPPRYRCGSSLPDFGRAGG